MDSTTPPPPGPGPGPAGSGPAGPGPAPGAAPGPTPPPGQPRPSGVDSFFDSLRRAGVVRAQDRWVGGVASGVALRLGVDALVVRGVLAVSVLLGGLGLVLYGLAWALLPEQHDGRIHLQQLFRGDFDVAVLGAFAVFIAGLSFPERWYPGLWWWGNGGWGGLLWLLAVAVVVVLVISSYRDRQGGGPRPSGPTTSLPRTPVPPPPSPEGPTMSSTTPTSAYPTPSGYAAPVSSHPGTFPDTGAAGGAGGYGGPPAGPPPVPPAPPTAYRPAAPPPGPQTPLPRTGPRGPGARAVGAVVALGLIGLAVLMYAERVGDYTGPVLLTAGAGTVVLAGLAIIVSGLRGRTSGSLGALAVLGILVLLPLSAVERSSWTWDSSSTAFGELVHTPRTVAEAEAGYSLGAGEARIDLTELPSSPDPIEVAVDVGAGEVTVVVPEGGDVLGEVKVFAGEVDWLGQSTTRVGGGTTSTYESDSVARGAEPELVLEISVGAGSVHVIED